MRLFEFIERLVTWEATADEEILETARRLIRLSTEGNPPPLPRSHRRSAGVSPADASGDARGPDANDPK
jgi:hypothetical protein